MIPKNRRRKLLRHWNRNGDTPLSKYALFLFAHKSSMKLHAVCVMECNGCAVLAFNNPNVEIVRVLLDCCADDMDFLDIV